MSRNPSEDARSINRAFTARLKTAAGIKESEGALNSYIRDHIREESVVRKILNAKTVTTSMLDRSAKTDKPRIIVEKEPDSVARTVPFAGAPNLREIRGERASVYFGKTQTDKWEKDVHSLSTYNVDIRKIIMDNMGYDLGEQEDRQFKRTLDEVIAANPLQSIEVTGPVLTRDALVAGLQRTINSEQPIGTILCSKSLHLDLLRLDASNLGDIVANRHYEKGIESEEKLWGYDLITTIKKDIFPPDELWIFPPQRFLGHMFLLQDATINIEQVEDMVRMNGYALPGMTLINTKGITRVKFT